MYIHMYLSLSLYIYIYTYIHTSLSLSICIHSVGQRTRRVSAALGVRPRENMVGVNMVLAELVKFKHGLYKSCGIEYLRVLC